MLTYALGFGIHVAIATAMFSYLFSGAVGAIEYSRRGSIQWNMGLWLCLGGMPGAYLGALATWQTPGAVLEGIIGLSGFFVGASGFAPAG
jgi:Sulfite exporter TauE/SafE.